MFAQKANSNYNEGMNGQHILVVDDDREIVRLLRGYLVQAGFQVLTAYDGEEALHTLRETNHHSNAAIVAGIQRLLQGLAVDSNQ